MVREGSHGSRRLRPAGRGHVSAHQCRHHVPRGRQPAEIGPTGRGSRPPRRAAGGAGGRRRGPLAGRHTGRGPAAVGPPRRVDPLVSQVGRSRQCSARNRQARRLAQQPPPLASRRRIGRNRISRCTPGQRRCFYRPYDRLARTICRRTRRAVSQRPGLDRRGVGRPARRWTSSTRGWASLPWLAAGIYFSPRRCWTAVRS